ncbi:Prefoldin subunit 4 [Hysterangium stoloniferum]|nr:Prefoldin subunit 4 [Hysterangium stoloniferum]
MNSPKARTLNADDETDDAEVTWEDQQRINTFSKLNSRARDLEEQLTQLKEEKEALDDLSMELELADEDKHILYRIGEAFVHIPLTKAQVMLTRDQASLNLEMDKVQAKADECEKTMKELKVSLYAKFGKAINLDI